MQKTMFHNSVIQFSQCATSKQELSQNNMRKAKVFCYFVTKNGIVLRFGYRILRIQHSNQDFQNHKSKIRRFRSSTVESRKIGENFRLRILSI